MDDKYDGSGNRCREVDYQESITEIYCRKAITEIDNFISNNDHGVFQQTRARYYENYILHLNKLYDADQIIIERDKTGNINGVCGWIVIDKKDEEEINKITWRIPSTINAFCNRIIPDRCVLHITFCVINSINNHGNINRFRQRLVELLQDKVDEVTWFNMPRNKYMRRKNILKDLYKDSYKGESHAIK